MRTLRTVALLAILASLAGCLSGPPTGGSPTPDPPPSAAGPVPGSAPGATTTISGDPHAAETAAHVDAVFPRTPPFPGAVELPPNADLDDLPGSTPPTFVRRTGWWTSSLRPEQLPSWLDVHLPQSWSLQGGAPDRPVSGARTVS